MNKCGFYTDVLAGQIKTNKLGIIYSLKSSSFGCIFQQHRIEILQLAGVPVQDINENKIGTCTCNIVKSTVKIKIYCT